MCAPCQGSFLYVSRLVGNQGFATSMPGSGLSLILTLVAELHSGRAVNGAMRQGVIEMTDTAGTGSYDVNYYY